MQPTWVDPGTSQEWSLSTDQGLKPDRGSVCLFIFDSSSDRTFVFNNAGNNLVRLLAISLFV